jgi:hypothetical protein
MTAAEVYDLTTQGGANDFARLIAICEAVGPYCLIGGLAVNCYVEPVYTLDADLVFATPDAPTLDERLSAEGFRIERHVYSLNAFPPGSSLRIQFTLDRRYQDFLSRARPAEVLGVQTRVACLQDVAQGKLWAYQDPDRRLTERKKDELDLIRLGEAYPELRPLLPKELLDQIERGSP